MRQNHACSHVVCCMTKTLKETGQSKDRSAKRTRFIKGNKFFLFTSYWTDWLIQEKRRNHHKRKTRARSKMKGQRCYRYSDVSFFFHFVVNPPSTAIAYDNDTVTFQNIARIVQDFCCAYIVSCEISLCICWAKMCFVCHMLKYIYIFSIFFI